MVLDANDRLDAAIETLLSYPRVESLTARAITRNLASDIEIVQPVLDRMVEDGRLRVARDGRYRRPGACETDRLRAHRNAR